MARSVILLILCAGCPNLVARSPRNAPGHVDLAKPPAHEIGDPASFEDATDPGEHRAMILPGGFVGIGQGRRTGAVELGAQLRWTFAEDFGESSKDDEFPYVWSAWGAAVGWGIVQFPDDETDTMQHAIGGPLFAEVNRTWSVCGVGAGPAVYPFDPEVGAQLTAWAGLFSGRVRYMEHSGFEIYFAYQLELPTVWTWSK